jgi:hypothetical protein
MEFIDKAAVVTEIKKRIEYYQAKNQKWGVAGYAGRVAEGEEILDYINTLEVIDVDLETAFAASIDHFDEKNNYGQWTEFDLRQFAKYFFELGLKMNKK